MVFSSILLEIMHKTLLLKGYIPSASFPDNALLGIELFIAMIGGLDLFRTYTILSWIHSMTSELLLSRGGVFPHVSANDYSEIARGIAPRDIVEGVLLTSLTFLGGVGVVLGVALRLNKLARMTGLNEVNPLKCYFTAMTSCKSYLNLLFPVLINGFEEYYSTGEEVRGDRA